ncbi:hypothetical protein P872_21415 [Rhodonellum psychrophilum GCM71 = DSM 17998]|uniref:Uncharacterized protein n=1 Tax=Rhodonellum psychrophilum GCM71 = DSM 17998 TaxID=1123057 RepID=U5BXQ2_9BACT|nr:hypothetical protein P872_21415 [Rhodonellum psychrophilum GCM71 = DSM 17998]
MDLKLQENQSIWGIRRGSDVVDSKRISNYNYLQLQAEMVLHNRV